MLGLSGNMVGVFAFLLLTTPMMPGESESRKGFEDVVMASSVSASQGTRWAVLVAGSSGYENFRHQADVCHAYQILKKGGVKDENIIVFMYDDIAHDHHNPTPGIIINKPSGPDVYKGVPKDYTHDQTTAANLYAVLLGNKARLTGGSGKVLKSGPNDHVFFYYADHGSTGLLSMPVGDDIYAKDLMNVLKQMHKKKMYKSMVMYIEACESGSIVQGLLPSDIGIYTTTASSPTESSWAYYCPGGDSSDAGNREDDPSKYGTCLGDLYSIAWMEDSDTHDLAKETLRNQYVTVKKRTTMSKVMEYGNKGMNKDFLSTYLGQNSKSATASTSTYADNSHLSDISYRAVPQRDADLVFFQHKVAKAPKGSVERVKAQKLLDEKLAHRSHVDRNINLILNYMLGNAANVAAMLTKARPADQPVVDDWDCFKTLVRTYEQHCGRLGNYGLQYTRAMANMCNAGVNKDQMVAASILACA